MAYRLAGRRCRSDARGAGAAWLRRDLRFEHLAKAALAAWTDEAAKAREEYREIFHRRRDHLLGLLSNELGLRCVTPEGAFYTMVDVSAYGDEMRVAEAGLEQGVVTIPAASFGDESKGFLRISFCANEERLSEGVRVWSRAGIIKELTTEDVHQGQSVLGFLCPLWLNIIIK